MQNLDVFIHIGFPKTATSLLQERYFPNLTEALYLGKREEISEEYRKAIANLSTTNISAVTQDTIHRVFNYISKRNSDRQADKVIISDECFAGGENDNFLYLINGVLALRKVFGNPKIIFTFRKQDEFLEEVYRQNIRGGYSSSVSYFLNYQNGEFGQFYRSARNNVDVHSVSWMGFHKFLCEQLGAENVLAVPYEMLKFDPELFFDRIGTFLGTSPIALDTTEYVNKMDSYYALKTLNFLNKFVNNQRNGAPLIIQNPLLPFLPPPTDSEGKMIRGLRKLSHKMTFRHGVKVLNHIFKQDHNFFSDDLRRKIMDVHKAENMELAELLEIDLKEYGYF